MQITGDLNDEYLIMSMISRHVLGPKVQYKHERKRLFDMISKHVLVNMYFYTSSALTKFDLYVLQIPT